MSKKYADISLPSVEEIYDQREKLYGTSRHDTKESRKYHAMNLSKFDVYLPHDVGLDVSVYNKFKEQTRRSKRKETGKGKKKSMI